jgi:hypothetical protein
MNTENTFLKFENSKGQNHYVSINEIIVNGIPWDTTNDNEMNQVDTDLYQWKDTDRGWQFVPI